MTGYQFFDINPQRPPRVNFHKSVAGHRINYFIVVAQASMAFDLDVHGLFIAAPENYSAIGIVNPGLVIPKFTCQPGVSNLTTAWLLHRAGCTGGGPQPARRPITWACCAPGMACANAAIKPCCTLKALLLSRSMLDTRTSMPSGTTPRVL